jgi:hypothetical protein
MRARFLARRIATPIPWFRSFSVVAARSAAPPEGPSLVKSFLYGSEKGQELQREMEQSYSKVLARGKYVHKLDEHFVKPDKVEQYVALMYPPFVFCLTGQFRCVS